VAKAAARTAAETVKEGTAVGAAKGASSFGDRWRVKYYKGANVKYY